MSNGAARPVEGALPAECDRLELAVRRLMEDYARWRKRTLAAERRVQELEATLAELSAGVIDPLTLNERIQRLEAENQALSDRLRRAATHVERLMARIHFLEGES